MKRKELETVLTHLEGLAIRLAYAKQAGHPRAEIPDNTLRQELNRLRQTIEGEPEYQVPLKETGNVSWVLAAIDIIERQRKELAEFRSRHRANACGMGKK